MVLRQTFPLFISLLVLLLTVGCDDRNIQTKPKVKAARKSPWEKKPGKPSISVKTHGLEEVKQRPLAMRPNRRFAEDNSSSLETRTSFAPAGTSATATYLTDTIRAATDYGPTLVVWVVDRTDSAQAIRFDTLATIRSIYAGNGSPQLLSAVIGYGQRVDGLPEPTPDGQAVIDAFAKLPRDDSGREVTFTALRSAAERYLPFRTQERREVLFVLVTDETGDDASEAESTIALLKKHVMPVYVVTVPAPLGKPHLGDMKAEARSDGTPGVVFGPESREVEMVAIESIGGNYDLDVLDSGFGPFTLEWLARASDGKLLASRPTYSASGFFGLPGSEWPTSRARQFDAAVMKKYAPDYVSAAEYEALLNANSAARALVAAAKLPRAEVRTQLNLTFAKRNEAQFAKDLSKAQQGAAKLEPAIERLYETLFDGEADRAKLTAPRWQAGYDVAMGRTCAAKARIEGYNAMLALLKQGKNFERPDSKTWRLEPAENSAQAGSAINKLVERSQTYLKRVSAEHPGTPWALIAERELQEQVGWKWVEE